MVVPTISRRATSSSAMVPTIRGARYPSLSRSDPQCQLLSLTAKYVVHIIAMLCWLLVCVLTMFIDTYVYVFCAKSGTLFELVSCQRYGFTVVAARARAGVVVRAVLSQSSFDLRQVQKRRTMRSVARRQECDTRGSALRVSRGLGGTRLLEERLRHRRSLHYDHYQWLRTAFRSHRHRCGT